MNVSQVIKAIQVNPPVNRGGVVTMVNRYLIFAMFVISVLLAGCESPASSPQLEQGWVTNCSGPAFRKFGGSGPGPERPVFRITDQLVLAVPKQYRPSANRIDRAPRECAKIEDLPRAHFVQFIIQGDWSAGYDLKDMPTVQGGLKQFRPDRVWVRVEPQMPNRLTPEEQQEDDRIRMEYLQKDSAGIRTFGGITCLVDKGGTWLFCSGNRTNGDSDVIKFRVRLHTVTPFFLLQADYVSSRYGGLQIYWQAWTSDIAHGSDIDMAVFKFLADWNLLNTAESRSGRN